MGPSLPSAGDSSTIGVLITTVADDGGITQTQAELTTLGDTAKKTSADSTSAFDSFNSSLKSVGSQVTAVGKSLSTYVTAPIVGIAAESVKMAMTFQQSMELLHTNAGVPQAAIAGLSQQILDMASEVGQGPDALATAFYHIATAGQGIWTTAQQLDVLRIASEGAAVGQADLDDTTYALTSTMAANVIGAQNANEAMGTLLGTVQSGDMHLSDLNAAIGTGLMGTLSTFGVSLQSAGAALADLGDNGEKGAAAATRLRMMLTLMVSPSQAATKELSALGLTASDAATATGTMSAVFAETGLSTTKLADDLRQPNGIYVAITDLKTHLDAAGLSASETDSILSKAFGGGRTDAALLQLLDTTGRLDLKYQQIGQDSGDFADSWQAQQQTMKEQWDKAWGGIEADMIRLGEAIMPEVSKAMSAVGNAVSEVSNWFESLNGNQKQFVLDAALVAAAAGPVLMVFGTMAKSLSEVLSLTSTVGKGLGGIMDLFKGATGIGGDALGAEALAGGAEATTGSLGGLAAVLTGPVGIALAATTAAVVGGVLVWDKWHQSVADSDAVLQQSINNSVDPYTQKIQLLTQSNNDMVISNDGVTQGTSMLAIAQTSQKNTLNDVAGSQAAYKQIQQQTIPITDAAAKSGQTLQTAQSAYNTAVQKFGVNSPQAITALQNLQTAQDNFNVSQNTAIGQSLTLYSAYGDVVGAMKTNNDAITIAAQLQDTLNGKYVTGVPLVGGFGNTVAGVVGQLDNANTQIGIMLGAAPTIAGMIVPIQGMATNLQLANEDIGKIQNTVSSKGFQGGVTLQLGAGGSLQGSGHFASGTNNAPGGWSTVGENGPENMYIPAGSMVKTAAQTASMGGGSSSNGVTIYQTNNNYSNFDLAAANRELAWRVSNVT